MLEKLKFLYGVASGKRAYAELQKIIAETKSKIKCVDRELWDEKDVFLLTYPDSFQDGPDSRLRGNDRGGTLKTLKKFLDLHLKDVISGVHILPFYPYSSDRGFSITDYYQVKKEFGGWSDVENIAKNYRLMTDLVLNHVSVKHEWFQKFLAGDEKYENYFIWFKKEEIPWEDIKKVVRPRSTPLLTPFQAKKGERWVWTTYSVGNFTDQVDLNYHNPEVLLEMVKAMVNLLIKKTQVLRLDAVAGLWKELGTSCSSLPQTHVLIQIFREFSDRLCPQNLLITESSRLTHKENMTYFGHGDNESHLIYNFPIAPLTLAAFYSGHALHLTDWAKEAVAPSQTATFFNFLDCHDGINVGGAQDFLSDVEYRLMFDTVEKRGGKFSQRSLPDGSKTVKEMNITWWSALNEEGTEPFELQLQKFITSRAMAMSISGIPAIYYLSLFGGENDTAAYQKSKHGRDINRTNLDFDLLETKLSDPVSREAKIFRALIELIKKRKAYRAFHPNAKQEALSLDKRVFVVLRGEGKDKVIALHNVSKDKVDVSYGDRTYNLEPYGYIWDLV